MSVASSKCDLVYIALVNIGEREKARQIGIIIQPFNALLKSLHSSSLSAPRSSLLSRSIL